MKKQYRLRYLKKAQKDLFDIFEYVKLDKPFAASKLIDKFDKTLKRLENFPFSGVSPRDLFLRQRGYRLVIIDDYLAFYLIKGKYIIVQRIIHGKQRYSFLLEKNALLV